MTSGTLEPMRKKRGRLGDLVVLLTVLAVALSFLWLYYHSEKLLKPDESDCVEQLRMTTRKNTNFTEDEVVYYGRCLLDSEERR